MDSNLDAKKELNDLKENVFRNLREAVKDAQIGKEIYFHDLVHEETDSWVASFSRSELIDIIDECGNEANADKGIVDTSSLDRILVTLAYECANMWLFDDDEMQELQQLMNNEPLTEENKKRILELTDGEKEKG